MVFLFSINFSYRHKKIKTYINDEDFAGIGGVYEASTKSHKYLLIEFIQEYATSYWLFQENLKRSKVTLLLKNMYLRDDEVIPPKRAASKSRINTSPAFSAGRVSLLKPSYAFALE